MAGVYGMLGGDVSGSEQWHKWWRTPSANWVRGKEESLRNVKWKGNKWIKIKWKRWKCETKRAISIKGKQLELRRQLSNQISQQAPRECIYEYVCVYIYVCMYMYASLYVVRVSNKLTLIKGSKVCVLCIVIVVVVVLLLFFLLLRWLLLIKWRSWCI